MLGRIYRWGYGSLQPEAQGKNAIAVGATRTAAAAREDFVTQTTAQQMLCDDDGSLSDATYERLRALVLLCGRTVPDPTDNTTALYPIGSWEYKVLSQCLYWGDHLSNVKLVGKMGSYQILNAYLCGSDGTDGALATSSDAFCCEPPTHCECLDSWQWLGQQYSGCAHTPDDEQGSWCFVNNATCPVSGQFAGGHFVYCNTFEYPNATVSATAAADDAPCAHTQCEGKLGLAVYALLSERWRRAPDQLCCHSRLGAEWDRLMINEEGTSMAVFSSRGPSWDGRIKPDVVAPGWTFSARSQAVDDPDHHPQPHCSRAQSVQFQVSSLTLSCGLGVMSLSVLRHRTRLGEMRRVTPPAAALSLSLSGAALLYCTMYERFLTAPHCRHPTCIDSAARPWRRLWWRGRRRWCDSTWRRGGTTAAAHSLCWASAPPPPWSRRCSSAAPAAPPPTSHCTRPTTTTATARCVCMCVCVCVCVAAAA